MRLKATVILSLSTLSIKLCFQAQEEPNVLLWEKPYQEMAYKTEDYMVFAATAADSFGDYQLEFVDHNGLSYYYHVQ
jgi:hypothetical protein